MSENYPPTGDQVPEVPQVPEAPAVGVPVVSDAPAAPVPSLDTTLPVKPKINWLFFLLGFVAPAVAATIQALLLSGLSQVQALAPLGMLGGLLQLAVIVVAIWAFVTGKRSGNNKLRSFGIGAFVAFVVSALVLLLAFGACLVSLGTGGNFLGG